MTPNEQIQAWTRASADAIKPTAPPGAVYVLISWPASGLGLEVDKSLNISSNLQFPDSLPHVRFVLGKLIASLELLEAEAKRDDG